MADANQLDLIWLPGKQAIPVQTLSDETITIAPSRGRITIRDEDLKTNEEGKYVIDLAPLELAWFYPNHTDLPKVYEVPADMWNNVKSYFEDFGQEGTMTGFLTCEPGKVAEILKISIE